MKKTLILITFISLFWIMLIPYFYITVKNDEEGAATFAIILASVSLIPIFISAVLGLIVVALNLKFKEQIICFALNTFFLLFENYMTLKANDMPLEFTWMLCLIEIFVSGVSFAIISIISNAVKKLIIKKCKERKLKND